jgi:predicted O-linked N-acetylglucosamine transferase (SPINDLY family)
VILFSIFYVVQKALEYDMLNSYLDQYIYKIIKIRYPALTPEELGVKIKIIFKQLINGIRDITSTVELDPRNTPMGFLFQHLRDDIVRLVANCSPPGERDILIGCGGGGGSGCATSSLDWNIRLFKNLVALDAKDVIIWYFLQIPYYIENYKEQARIRGLYMQLLDYFISSWPVDYIITEEEFLFASNETCMPYAAAYHNQNNNLLLAKYHRLIRKIAPWVNYYSPRIAEDVLKNKDGKMSAREKRKQRICFITDSFATDSSVLRDRIGIIGKLDRARFDIYIAGFAPVEAYRGILADVFIKKYKTVYIHLGNNLSTARRQLEALELDIIIYPDLGMKVLPTLLAYSRLAKVQITTWGHSETSGIDTIDYYVSSRWFELDSASVRYTEKLILFKSLGTYYFSPHTIFIDNNATLAKPYKFKTATELGFPEGAHLYCCLQTFYKISPEFESALARILQLDREGIILLSNGFPYCRSHLARLHKVIGNDNIGRVRWIPAVDKTAFLNLVAICDVCLDPFPFGGCNTTFEAFDYNIPVITWPSTQLHGRFTYGLYGKMDMADCECIVGSAEDYAQIASRVAMNSKLRHKIQRAIETGKSRIFQERESVDEWNEFLEKI